MHGNIYRKPAGLCGRYFSSGPASANLWAWSAGFFFFTRVAVAQSQADCSPSFVPWISSWNSSFGLGFVNAVRVTHSDPQICASDRLARLRHRLVPNHPETILLSPDHDTLTHWPVARHLHKVASRIRGRILLSDYGCNRLQITAIIAVIETRILCNCRVIRL
ncbi:hypothetical protein BDZ85DRAFT_257702 [Elsinoe ampelina]|uniref:Uncharacterized protein n=1 Tax=Elsinoe ampelina TaxID=302913 RepID=A0A6A6GIJ8_9PEZI|nr:hypothetical protein BDZ85DRAFT_257702 [Elsinoe ampelina]